MDTALTDAIRKLPCDLDFTEGRFTLTEELCRDGNSITYAAYFAEREMFCAVRVYAGAATESVLKGDAAPWPIAVIQAGSVCCVVSPLCRKELADHGTTTAAAKAEAEAQARAEEEARRKAAVEKAKAEAAAAAKEEARRKEAAEKAKAEAAAAAEEEARRKEAAEKAKAEAAAAAEEEACRKAEEEKAKAEAAAAAAAAAAAEEEARRKAAAENKAESRTVDISLIFKMKHDEMLSGATFTSDNLCLIIATPSGGVHLCLPQSQQIVLSHTLPFRIHSLAYSKEDNRLVVAAENRGVLKMNPRNGMVQPYILEAGDISLLSFSNNGKTMALAATETKAALYDTATQERRLAFAHNAALTAIAVAPSQPLLASAHLDGTAYVTSAATQQTVLDLSTLHQGYIIRGLAFSRDGSSIAGAGADSNVYVTNIAECRITNAVHFNSPATAVAFAPHADVLVSGWENGYLCFTDTQRQTTLAVIDTGIPIAQMHFSSDGSMLAVIFTDGHIHVYDTASLCS